MKSHVFFLGTITAVVVDIVCADCLIILAVLSRFNPTMKLFVRDCNDDEFQAKLNSLTDKDRVLYIGSSETMEELLIRQEPLRSKPILAGILVREAATNWQDAGTGWPHLRTIFGARVNLLLPIPVKHISMRKHLLESFEYWDEDCLRILTDPTIGTNVQRCLSINEISKPFIVEHLIAMLHNRAQWEEEYLPLTIRRWLNA